MSKIELCQIYSHCHRLWCRKLENKSKCIKFRCCEKCKKFPHLPQGDLCGCRPWTRTSADSHTLCMYHVRRCKNFNHIPVPVFHWARSAPCIKRGSGARRKVKLHWRNLNEPPFRYLAVPPFPRPARKHRSLRCSNFQHQFRRAIIFALFMLDARALEAQHILLYVYTAWCGAIINSPSVLCIEASCVIPTAS